MDKKQARIFTKAIRQSCKAGRVVVVEVHKDKFFPFIHFGDISNLNLYDEYEYSFSWGDFGSEFGYMFSYHDSVELFIDAKKGELSIWDKQFNPERTVTIKPVVSILDESEWVILASELEEAKNE